MCAKLNFCKKFALVLGLAGILLPLALPSTGLSSGSKIQSIAKDPVDGDPKPTDPKPCPPVVCTPAKPA